MNKNKCPDCENENKWCVRHQKKQIELENKGYSILDINFMMNEFMR